MADAVQVVSLAEESNRRYLNYALSVITSRALPDVRDGLKPVQRRILYTMHQDLRLHPDGRPRKCAKIVGEVMGNYHPHGDSAIYDALVRMAQDFAMRIPLVHGQGNFGSVDGDPAAAYRYTEAKLAPLSKSLLTELEQQTVTLRDNFDASRREPVVLPAQLPNILINGASGIAVGLATNIPPHNPKEVINAAIQMLDKPESTTAELLKHLKGPDFPLGGKAVIDKAALERIYETGSGTIRVQAKYHTEKEGDKDLLVVTAIPYAVNKSALESAIGELIATKKIPQLTNLSNESSEKEGIRIVLEMQADANPETVMAYLFKHTAMQQAYSYNMTCLVPGINGSVQPQRLGLKDILHHFLAFRRETVRNRFNYELKQLEKRIHLLEGFAIVFNNIKKAVDILLKSKNKEDAGQKIKAAFKIDDVQTDAVLSMALYRLAASEIKDFLQELKEKSSRASAIKKILASPDALTKVIRDELRSLSEEYNEKRRTQLSSDDGLPEFDPGAYIIEENTNIILTRDGWIKRANKISSIEQTRLREGDEVIAVIPTGTKDVVVFFADDGTSYALPVVSVPLSSGFGEPISKFFRLGDGSRVIAAVTTDARFTNEKADYVAVTAAGVVSRTKFGLMSAPTGKNGRKYIRLKEGDKVVMAKVLGEEASVVFATQQGKLAHIKTSKIPESQRPGAGVTAIGLEAGDVCIGAAAVVHKSVPVVVTTDRDALVKIKPSDQNYQDLGGAGTAPFKRTKLKNIKLGPIQLVDWNNFGNS